MAKKNKKTQEFVKQNRQVNPSCPYTGLCPAAHTRVMNDQASVLKRKHTFSIMFVYVIMGWALLMRPTTDGQSYCTSLIFYVFPLLWDAWRISPFNIYLKISKFIQVVIFFSVLIIAGLGAISSILTIQNVNDVLSFVVVEDSLVLASVVLPVKYVWLSIGLGIAFMAGECFSYRTANGDAMVNSYRSAADGT